MLWKLNRLLIVLGMFLGSAGGLSAKELLKCVVQKVDLEKNTLFVTWRGEREQAVRLSSNTKFVWDTDLKTKEVFAKDLEKAKDLIEGKEVTIVFTKEGQKTAVTEVRLKK